MARVLVAAQSPGGAYPALPLPANSADLQMQAGDASLGNYTPLVDGKTLVICQNTNSGSTARTVTFDSAVDAFNRTGDITAYSLGAGEIGMFGPFKTAGWVNAGNLNFDVSHAEMKIAVITLP